MTTIHAKAALTPDGWRENLRIRVENGLISALETGEALAGDICHAVVVPGMPNLHSHAFQRGMAGLAETRGASRDSFWSWREVMYRFALTLSPEQVEAVAAELYIEMLEAGFTRVGEFHYLHHDLDGRAYADPAEMAARIAAAAGAAGIGLTLLPVFYAHSNFGGAAPASGQRRFLNDLDGFAALLDGARRHVAALPGGAVGLAPHSLRAVTAEELAALTDLAGSGPVHIHIAEQTGEVEACLTATGARPVEWLLDHAAVDPRWCLVHATHMTADETARLARSGAVAGLCPITEANLGDGIFSGAAFAGAGGAWGIGSDSNVELSVAGELRMFEYSQRLAARARNVMSLREGSTGRQLFDAALAGGARALGVEAGLAIGAPADFVTLRADHPAVVGRGGDALVDGWIFSAGNGLVDCVYARGRKCVEGGRHVARPAIEARFRQTLQAVLSA
ncbi:formimidoylglutamate deiminase [Oryzibacter oryziterrae]|uniref:formimidoylglutamate deiminase n=1 Tax=Oryzibacter oryziterrae TaxID=2766474 RepID=UPI001F001902|nr:formimidoylglutamate deiminase [Oryzibacter oryziterrae]